MALSPEMRKYVIDLGERTVATFGVAALAVVVAAGPADFFNVDTWQVAATAGLASVGTLLKGGVAFFRGQKSASLAKSI